MAELREHRLNLCLTDAEMTQIETCAKERGLLPGTFARHVLVHVTRKDVYELIKKLIPE